MVTPMRPDGSLDLDGAATLATHLVDVEGNDALVISGTTGDVSRVYLDRAAAAAQTRMLAATLQTVLGPRRLPPAPMPRRPPLRVSDWFDWSSPCLQTNASAAPAHRTTSTGALA